MNKTKILVKLGLIGLVVVIMLFSVESEIATMHSFFGGIAALIWLGFGVLKELFSD